MTQPAEQANSRVIPHHSRITFKVVRGILRFLYWALTDVHYEGLEHFPRQGGALITINHQSMLDTPVFFILPHRDDMTALVTDKYKKNFLVNLFVNWCGGIWIDREKADFTAMRQAIQKMREGYLIGIAPEGTRSKTGGMIPAKMGAALLAERGNVPIIPVGITGTEDAVARIKRFRRPTITIHFGEAFTLPPTARDTREADMQRNTDEIMCRIAALLPESYHGVYKDHPRLKELLQTQSEH